MTWRRTEQDTSRTCNELSTSSDKGGQPAAVTEDRMMWFPTAESDTALICESNNRDKVSQSDPLMFCLDLYHNHK